MSESTPPRLATTTRPYPALAEQIAGLKPHDHVCSIYRSLEEQFSVAAEFIKAGLAGNEKCNYIADDNTCEVVLGELKAAGIDVDACMSRGALSLYTRQNTYMSGGHFDADPMLELVERSARQATEEGFTALRLTGEMTWALESDVDLGELIEYESKLNFLLPRIPILVLCQYNAQRFDPSILRSVIQTHPLVIYGNVVARNYYYIRPDDFLSDRAMSAETMLQSVSEQEKTRVALELSRTRLARQYAITHSLIESSLDPLMTISLDGRITDVNGAVTEITGLSREELIGMDGTRTFTEPDRARQGLQELVAIGSVRNVALTVPHKDGGLKDVLVNGTLHKDAAGNILGAFVASRDITEIRKFEKELKALVCQQAVVAEMGLLALRTSDVDALMNEIVTAVQQQLGTDLCQILELLPSGDTFLLKAGVGWPEGIIGQSTVGAELSSQAGYTLLSNFPVIVGDLSQESRFTFPQLLKDEGAVSGMSCVIPGRERPYGVLATHTRHFHEFTGHEPFFLQSVANVLSAAIERRTAEEERERMNNELERRVEERTGSLLAANQQLEAVFCALAHDLRSPLSGAAKLVDLLLSGKLTAGEHNRYLSLIADTNCTALRLVQNLLDVNRIDSNAYVLCLETVDIGGLVESCCREAAPLAAVRNISIDTKVRSGLELLVHAFGIQRVMQNLLDNALKFTPAGSTICVSVNMVDSQIVIEVKDCGPGMSVEDQAHLFQRFWQGGAGKKHKTGTGLGLYLCKHILAANGGEISYHTHGEDGGAVFTVVLPARTSNVASNGEPAKPLVSVLLVEDMTITRASLKMLLDSEKGLSVVGEACDGESAWNLANQLKPAVIFMDIGLPDTSGIELCRRIKSVLPKTRILMLTSHESAEDVLASLAAGADGYCLKDVSQSDLARAARTIAAGGVWLDRRIAGL